MRLIVGLGNPGKQYAKTRHNVGFMVLDELHRNLKDYQISSWELSKKFNALVSGCTVKAEKIILAKPTTFMNDSGQAVQLIAHFYKMTHQDIIVVHDDKDLNFGDLKVQTDRGHAGHNGVASIMECVGSKNFTRYRIGIKSDNPKKMTDTAKFVLGKFSIWEKSKLNEVIKKSTENLLILLKE